MIKIFDNMNIKQTSSKQIFLLIILLAITPFVLFLGKNFSQIEFFTAKFFWLAFTYCLLFMFIGVFALYFSKKYLIVVLFFAYFSFLQFYFSNMQEILEIYKDGSTGFYILFFLLFISFIAALSSNLLVFTNFVLILLSLNIVISFKNLIPLTSQILQTSFKTTYNIDSSSNTKKSILAKNPNIFFIIPDGLTSPKILKSYSGIDFKDSIKKFQEKGFSVSKHNYSSYNLTYLSLAALFKMDYPVTEKSPRYKNRLDFYPSIREKKPELLEYLKKKNYKFVLFPPLWGGCPSFGVGRCFKPKEDSLIQTFLNDYAIVTFLHNSLLKQILNMNKFSKDQKMDDSMNTALNKIKTNPEIWSEGGIFTLIHAMMPHSPYREEDCAITDRYTYPSKEGYKSSVYCSFKRIHELSDFIITNYPNASIVVQGDHGIYDKVFPKNKKFAEISDSFIDARMGAFSAVKGCGSNQASKLNQANIVKYIVECLVGNKISMELKNQSYFAFYEDSIEYGKVFSIKQK